MDPSDIEKLFLQVLDDPGMDTDETRQVFATLIQTTLAYRDQLLKSQNIVVTVEDVRAVLGWLVPALSIGQWPETRNEIRLGLLKAWVRELG